MSLSQPTRDSWGELDPSLLEEGRGTVPTFPLDTLPAFWRSWVETTARSTTAPIDYLVQSVLAAVAGVAGVGAQVRITSRWSEPMILWQAMVGPPSSGKSSAMAPMRDVLAELEAKPAADGSQKPRRLVDDAEIDCVADALDAHSRGVILWRDEPGDLLPRLGCVEHLRRGDDALRASWLNAWSGGPVALERGARRFNRFPVSLLVALRPERLVELSHGGEEYAARFLFTWPHAPAHTALIREPLHDEEALISLRRLGDRLSGPPVTLSLDDYAFVKFDAFANRLNTERRELEGLEAAWIGKGASMVTRLAGILELLTWMRDTSADPPALIAPEQVERAIDLWSGYFRPHALALFHREIPTDQERRARQVVRWLRQLGDAYVSREDVRCKALRRTVNAGQAEQILYRLGSAGVVQRDMGGSGSRGRPTSHWFVNPAVFAQPSA